MDPTTAMMAPIEQDETQMDKMKALAQISSLAQLVDVSPAAFLIVCLLVCLVAFVVFDN